MEYKVFNPDYLVNITGGDAETLQEIVTIFRNQMPEFVRDMKNLHDSGKFFELGLLAHKAKGSVTVMGMDETAKMLKEFELKAKAGEEKDKYPGFISRFETDTATVLSEIDHYLSTSH